MYHTTVATYNILWKSWPLGAILTVSRRAAVFSLDRRHEQSNTDRPIALPLFVTWSVESVAILLILARAMPPGAWAHLMAQPGFWQVFTYAYQLVAYSWYLLLVPLAVRVAHQLRWWQALVVGLLTLLVAGLWVALFIR